MAANPNAMQLQLVLVEEEAPLETSFERYEQGEINLTEARLYAGQQIITHEIEHNADETLDEGGLGNGRVEPVVKATRPVKPEPRTSTGKRRSKPWRPPKPRTAYQRMLADRRDIPAARKRGRVSR